jgi:hypothetical protein
MAKSTTKVSGWRSRSTGFLAGVSAAVLIVVLIGGMALGYEIEKSRVKHTTKSAQKRNAKAAKSATTNVLLGGTVTTNSGTTISFTSKAGAKHKVKISSTTVVVSTDSANESAISKSDRVLIALAGFGKAKAVIVLPKSFRMGSTVVSAGAGSLSLEYGKSAVKLTTTGATVATTTSAKISLIKKGNKVMVRATHNKKTGVYTGLEIIVLPSNSPFV